MKTHYLKTWPEYFSAIRRGYKTFEIRRNDRDFELGDALVLEEWNPETGSYTGKRVIAEVIYVLKGAENLGLDPGFAYMSIKVAE